MPKKMLFTQWSIIGIVLILQLLAILPPYAGEALFLGSLFILGMPHGFTDTATIWKSKRRYRLLIWYSVCVLVAFSLWLLFPSAVVYSFLLVTAFHWGTGDFLHEDLSLLNKCLLGISKGLMLLSAAFSFSYNDSLFVLNMLGARYGADHDIQIVYTVILISSSVIYFGLSLWKKNRSQKARFSTEGVLIILMLYILPPLLGIMTYYTVIHSIRHYNLHYNGFMLSHIKSLSWNHLSCALFIGIPLIIFLKSTNSILPSYTEHHLKFIMFLTLPHAIMAWQIYARKNESVIDHAK